MENENNLQICFNAGCSSFSKCDECQEKEAAKAEIIRQLREAYPAPNGLQMSNRIYKDDNERETFSRATKSEFQLTGETTFDAESLFGKQLANPKTEIQFDDGGIAGLCLKEMRNRGWRIMTTPLETNSRLEGTQIKVDVSLNSWFEKYGKRESQENWNKELREVYDKLTGSAAPLPS